MFFSATLLALIGATLATFQRAQNVATDNSIFPGDGAHAVGAEGIHDPTIIEFGGKFFCFCTSGNSFTVVRASSSLHEWKVEGPIFSDSPEWLKPRYRHRSIWAPDIVVLGKKLRMYYCASDFGTNNSVIGLAECEEFDPSHPTKGWKDLGLILESRSNRDAFNAIDPEVLVDEHQKHWLFFGSYFGGIYVSELDPLTGKLLSNNYKIVAKNTSDRGNALEGAAVKRHGNFYYLFVSYGLAAQGVRSTYRIMTGRSASPAGPFVDLDGRDMVDGGHTNVLKTSPPMFSPGHCDVMQDHTGRWLMPYHFYDGRKYWRNDLWGLPTLQIRELLWSNDGWPLPGLPVESEFAITSSSSDTLAGTWIHQPDFGTPMTIEFRVDGTILGGTAVGKWRKEGNILLLEWPKADVPGEFWKDRLQLAYGDNYYVGRNQAGQIVRGVRRK